MKNAILSLALILSFALSSKAQWTQVQSGTTARLEAVHFFDSQNGLITGGFTNALGTTDGGNSWSASGRGFRDYGFYDDNYGYGASVAGMSMARTINGGKTWTSLNPPTSNSLWGVASTSPTTAYFVGTGGVLWKTTNSGATFTVENSGTTQLITDIAFPNSTTGFIAVQTGQIRKTTNSGSTWSTAHTIAGAYFTEMDFVNENTGYVVGYNGLIVKTTDGGSNWTTLQTNSLSGLQGVSFFDDKHGIAVGSGGTILYTKDGGANWDLQTSGTTEMLYDVFMISPTNAIVMGDKGIILKNNNIVTGIEEKPAPQEEEVVLYPNPVQDKLMIRATDRISFIEITDVTGKTVFSNGNILAGDYPVDLSACKAGVYFVNINTSSGKQTRKIIK